MRDSMLDIVSFDEYNFIKTIDDRFPRKHIADNFNLFAALRPNEREQLAQSKISELARAGWVRIGTPAQDVQTVAEHQYNMAEIAKIKKLGDRVEGMSLVHDMTEGVVTDFTPVDDISREDKSRLESIAVRVLFGYSPYKHKLWLEYEEGKTKDAMIAKDLDQIEMVNYATYIESRNRNLKEALDPFWDYAEKKIKTKLGQDFFLEAKKNRVNVIRHGKSNSDVYLRVYDSKINQLKY